MMIYRVLATSVLASLVGGTACAAPAELRLDPSSKWDIDYGLERCSLMREFGSGDAAVHLQMDSFGALNGFRVILTGSAVPQLRGPTGTVRIRLTGDAQESQLDTLQGAAGDWSAVSFGLAFAPYIGAAAVKAMPEEERSRVALAQANGLPAFDATVDSLTVTVPRGRQLRLELGNMAKPLVAMRACVDDMIKSWGGDPAVQRSLSRRAYPSTRTVWKVQGDYPREMNLTGTSAYVPVRLSIDAQGNPANCAVQVETVDQPFKDAVCKNLSHAFKPALDKDGKPVPSIVNTSVLYLISPDTQQRKVG